VHIDRKTDRRTDSVRWDVWHRDLPCKCLSMSICCYLVDHRVVKGTRGGWALCHEHWKCKVCICILWQKRKCGELKLECGHLLSSPLTSTHSRRNRQRTKRVYGGDNELGGLHLTYARLGYHINTAHYIIVYIFFKLFKSFQQNVQSLFMSFYLFN
jgi:hypothetical protein